MNYIDVSGSLFKKNQYVNARLSFFLKEKAKKAEFNLAACQYAFIWVNNKYIGQTYVRTHTNEIRAQEFDIKKHLKKGGNVIALLIHSWGEPTSNIAGTPDPLPIIFRCFGKIGSVDFRDLANWKISPAEEYLPAPRVGAVIGHEEYIDSRLEKKGWKSIGFNDSKWINPKIKKLKGIEVKPSILRPLKEEIAYPTKIVNQGILKEAYAIKCLRPIKKAIWWKLNFSVNNDGEVCIFAPSPGEDKEFYRRAYSSSIQTIEISYILDGKKNKKGTELTNCWLTMRNGLFCPIRVYLKKGNHEIIGKYLCANPKVTFGIKGNVNKNKTSLGWCKSEKGPYKRVEIECDNELSLLLQEIQPKQIGRLKNKGDLNIKVENDSVSVILDFEKNMTICPRIEIEDATPGCELEIIYSEQLSGFKELTFPGCYRDRIILRGGKQVYQTSFQYKSAQIIGINIKAKNGFVKIKKVSAIFRHYDYDETGTFNCSDKKLNSIYNMCKATMINASQDIIMDGPWREQLLYMGDNYVHNPVCYHLFGNSEIIEWQHTLFKNGQMQDGIIYPNQPYLTTKDHYRLLDQSILWPMQLEQHLLYTGRENFIKTLLGNMVKLMDGFQNLYGQKKDDPRLKDVNGWLWVDHQGLVDGEPGKVRNDGISTSLNLLYLLSLNASTRLLSFFGQKKEALGVKNIAEKLKYYLKRYHWDEKREVFVDCIVKNKLSPEVSIHTNLLAIESEIADEPEKLLNRVWNRPNILNMNGPFFRIHLLEVLHRLGKHNKLLSEIKKLWGSYIDAGLGTLPEYIPWFGDWGNSIGHPYGASPVIYFIKSIVGIYPIEYGWRKAVFSPHVCGLKKINVTIPTPYGPIKIDLFRKKNDVFGEIKIPKNIELTTLKDNLNKNIRVRTRGTG